MIFITIYEIFFNIFPDTYVGFLFCFSVIWIAIIFTRTVIRHSMLKKNVIRENTLKTTGNRDDLGSRHEGLRKLFHLSGFLLVICYCVVVPALVPMLSMFYSFPSNDDATMALTAFTLACGIVFVVYIDVQRIMFGETYGIRHLNSVMREKEIGSPGAQTYLLVGAMTSWIVAMIFVQFNGLESVSISLAVVVVSTLADGMAAIIGKAKGKHKINRPFNQTKSLEGFFAGFVTAFLVAVPFLIIYPYGWMLAFVIAIVFIIIDFASPPVADNLLNPIAITVILELLVMLV